MFEKNAKKKTKHIFIKIMFFFANMSVYLIKGQQLSYSKCKILD